MTDKQLTILFPVLSGILFLLLKLGCRHHAHKLTDVGYDPWQVLAWFGFDLALLGIAIALGRELDQFLLLTRAESKILYFVLALLALGSWIAYSRFLQRYGNALNKVRSAVWADWRACAWIVLSLYCGFLGFGIVVRGLYE